MRRNVVCVARSLARVSPVGALVAVAAFVINAAFTNGFPLASVWVTHFYASLGLAVLCVALLLQLDLRGLPERFVAVDRRLGDLSCPIFLLHYTVGVALCGLLWGEVKPESLGFLGLAFLLTQGAAVLLERVPERRLETLRTRVRVGEARAILGVFADR